MGAGPIRDALVGQWTLSGPKAAWRLLRAVISAWLDDDASTVGAALAFYTVFSIAPILILVMAFAGLAFGRQTAEEVILRQMSSLVGSNGAGAFQTVLAAGSKIKLGPVGTAIGLVTMLAGASAAFVELQAALNHIWKVGSNTQNMLVSLIKTRLLAFVLVIGTGVVLFASLLLSAMLSIVGKFMGALLPAPALLLETIHFLVSAGIITLLFGLIFKIVPDTKIPWSDVWIGAAVTALLFTIGKILIGAYLGRSAIASSSYGAAASLAFLLLWIYYSAQIFLFGAEFTHIYANTHGSRSIPRSHSEAA